MTRWRGLGLRFLQSDPACNSERSLWLRRWCIRSLANGELCGVLFLASGAPLVARVGRGLLSDACFVQLSRRRLGFCERAS